MSFQGAQRADAVCGWLPLCLFVAVCIQRYLMDTVAQLSFDVDRTKILECTNPEERR